MATRLIGVEISTNDDLLIKLRFHGGWAGTDRRPTVCSRGTIHQAGTPSTLDHHRSESLYGGDYTRIIISLRKESVS